MKLIGIDLGTTNSVIAMVNEFGKPEIIPNKEGERTTPSVVLFDQDQVVVGSTAKQSAVADPENTIAFIKSHMGDSSFIFTHRNADYGPEDISAMILRKLIDDAESFLDQKITDVVITVPAYFNDIQRKATIDAGKIAGVNVLQIINEPTAAALTYGLDKKSNQTIIVYDLGGGTFDVTIMKIGDNNFNVVSSDGDRHLGGNNFDEKLMVYLNNKFKAEHNIDLLDDLVLAQDLRSKAENIKKILSSKMSTTVYLSAQGRSSKIEVTRDIFTELIADLISRTQLLLESVLEDSQLEWDDIDQLLLVGGSTRIPAVYEMVKRVCGKEPAISINPDEAVALGAAIQAGIISAKDENSTVSDMVRMKFGSINVEDVTAHSFGAVTLDEYNNKRNAIIIPKNSKIPVRKSQIFYTTVPNQTSVKLTVLQGEDKDPEFCTILGTTTLEFPPKQINAPIIFNYEYDINGIINASAKDPETGKKSVIEIKREGSLSGNEILDKADKLNSVVPKRRDFIQKEVSTDDETDFIPPKVNEPVHMMVSELFGDANEDDGFISYEQETQSTKSVKTVQVQQPSTVKLDGLITNGQINYYEEPEKKGLPQVNAFNHNADFSDTPLIAKNIPDENMASDYDSKIDYYSEMDLLDELDNKTTVAPRSSINKSSIIVDRSEILTDADLNSYDSSILQKAPNIDTKTDTNIENTDPKDWEKIVSIMQETSTPESKKNVYTTNDVVPTPNSVDENITDWIEDEKQ